MRGLGAVSWGLIVLAILLTATTVAMLTLGIRSRTTRERVRYYGLAGIVAVTTLAVALLGSVEFRKRGSWLIDASFRPRVRAPDGGAAASLFATAM